MPRFCKIDGCEKPAEKRSWCGMHYRRWQRYGDPLYVKPPNPQRLCSIEGCGRPHDSRGWCDTHASRWRRTGDAMSDTPVAPCGPWVGASCSVEGCDRPVLAIGLCAAHYQRFHIHGDTFADTPIAPRYDADTCSVPGCNAERVARSWCGRHYYRWQTHGSTLDDIPKFRQIKRPCSACGHPAKADIERAMLSGEPYPTIERRYGLPQGNARNHAVDHLGLRRGPGAIGRTCPVCRHPDRFDIEDAILVHGETRKAVAARYGLPEQQTGTHVKPEHMAKALAWDLAHVQALRALSP